MRAVSLRCGYCTLGVGLNWPVRRKKVSTDVLCVWQEDEGLCDEEKGGPGYVGAGSKIRSKETTVLLCCGEVNGCTEMLGGR